MKSITALFVTLGSAAILQPNFRFFSAPPSEVIYQTSSTGVQALRHTVQPADSLAIYAGEYEIAPDSRLTLSVADGKLFILPPGETEKAVLKQINDTEFEVVGEAAKLTFQKDLAGNVVQVALRFGNGASVTAKKR